MMGKMNCWLCETLLSIRHLTISFTFCQQSTPAMENAQGNNNVASHDDSEDDEDDDDDDSSKKDEALTLGSEVLFAWDRRKGKIEHDYAVLGWVLSVMPDVRADVAERLNGDHRIAIERVITRLHLPPCPNKNKTIKDKDIGDIIHIFWKEFKHFQNKTGPFQNQARWVTQDALRGNSHVWHEMYSIPYTDVLGFVGARGCSKVLGIGACERSWSDVKHIKVGKRANLGGESTEKRSVLYTTAKINEARIKRNIMEQIDAEGENAMFGDDDMK